MLKDEFSVSTGLLIPNPTADPVQFGELISAQDALSAAMNSVAFQTDTAKATLANANVDGTEVEEVTSDPNIAGNVTSKLV